MACTHIFKGCIIITILTIFNYSVFCVLRFTIYSRQKPNISILCACAWCTHTALCVRIFHFCFIVTHSLYREMLSVFFLKFKLPKDHPNNKEDNY
jgi:hypothetical protein